MQMRYIVGSIAVAGSMLLAGTVGAFADDAMSSGVCATIAKAKFEQWRQVRLLVQRTKTFADGETKNDELIVTENTAYKLDRGGWTSAGITLYERAVPSPKNILTNMKLADCSQDGHDVVDGQPAMLYSYTYLPDGGGYVAHGRMWISEATNLPVREEFQEPAPPANAKIAKAISATYLYNDDVHIPQTAQLSNSQRLWNNAAVVRNMQTGGGGLGGPQQ